MNIATITLQKEIMMEAIFYKNRKEAHSTVHFDFHPRAGITQAANLRRQYA